MEEGSLVCEADYETVCNRLQGEEGSEVTGEGGVCDIFEIFPDFVPLMN